MLRLKLLEQWWNLGWGEANGGSEGSKRRGNHPAALTCTVWPQMQPGAWGRGQGCGRAPVMSRDLGVGGRQRGASTRSPRGGGASVPGSGSKASCRGRSWMPRSK